MIKIHFSNYFLLVTGHEESKEEYKLVCCAVSAVVDTGINSFFERDINVISKPGYLKAKLLHRTYKNKIMWKMLINQLYILYKSYNNVILWKRMENNNE